MQNISEIKIFAVAHKCHGTKSRHKLRHKFEENPQHKNKKKLPQTTFIPDNLNL